MANIQQINSRVNIKKKTSADIPFSVKQPVLAEYLAESTDGQTVINLNFPVDTVNAQSAFFIFIDGRKLTFGAANDYTMTAIDMLGFSSQVTMTQAISGVVNIQAYKLGAKKETEWAQDQRFTSLYEGMDQGFQGFVKQEMMNATSATGSPAAGTFHSTVVNRKAIMDLSKDLKPRMGIERISAQQIFQLQDEFGPNGETVFGLVNDTLNQVRFVGAWSSSIGASSTYIGSSVANDYIEITFYGTGLNVFSIADVARDCRVSVDGGAEGSNILTTQSAVLYGRGYNPNMITNAVSGLTLGVHTVKLRVATSAGNFLYGFEILNESSSVKTQPGTAYVQGKKLTSSIQNVLSYSSGVTGTRGGRMLIYQASDGSISRAFQATNGAQANLTSADHTNEEVARVYHWREFGANRADDFSTLTTSSSSRAFTLDDGSVTLVGQNALVGATGHLQPAGVNDFITLTFVGTGLDVIQVDGTASLDTTTVSVDGSSIGTLTAVGAANKERITKIISGLPYGTHTVRIFRTAAAGNPPTFKSFIVYQPKTPALPSGSVALGAFNVMADFVANTTVGAEIIATGVLRKSASREIVYVNGTGGTTDWTLANGPAYIGGFDAYTDRLNAYIEYTFVGTGFDLRWQSSANRTTNAAISLNGTALNSSYSGAGSITCSTYGTGIQFGGQAANSSFLLSAVASNVLDMQDAAGQSVGFRVSGLPYGKYTLKVNSGTAGVYLAPEVLDVIVPIHSHQSNLTYDQQNTLSIGSQSIADARNLSPIKDTHLQKKNISQAVGVTSAPTTASTSLVPIPEMSVTHKNASGKISVSYSIIARNATQGVDTNFAIFVDGIQVGPLKSVGAAAASVPFAVADIQNINVSPGVHKVDVYASVSSSTATFHSTSRNLLVEEK